MEYQRISSSKDLANQVKEFRKKNAMTQKQLAERVGVTQQTISAIESGSFDPSLKLLLLLAGILGLALLLSSLGKE